MRWKVSPSILLCNLISELGLSGVTERESETHTAYAGWRRADSIECVCGAVPAVAAGPRVDQTDNEANKYFLLALKYTHAGKE